MAKEEKDHDYELFRAKLRDDINKKTELAKTQKRASSKEIPKQPRGTHRQN
jgi:hypothetical protein